MNKTQIRIAYADTDKMGVVYHSNYLVYFEKGRTEFMRESGFTYTHMEELGFCFPVSFVQCKFVSPAKYDDIITVETKLIEITAASITCSYEIKKDSKLLVSGYTKHPFVDIKTFKPVRIPKDIREIFEKRLEK